mmetsp:Transcript_16305/g.24674  ORF Transcript_16305/g.24674 Transcript_16305/m.24674 type:complete len:168 (+) Transcript_16305:719-1222(+)
MLSRAKANDSSFLCWKEFCAELYVNPFLSNVDKPIIFLQVFAQRYRTGEIAPQQKRVQSCTVEQQLRAVAQTLQSVGLPDHPNDAQGKIDFRLQRQLQGYKCQDSPTRRVKPLPILVIRQIATLSPSSQNPASLTILHLITIAFYFLLQPGDYKNSTADTHPSVCKI